MGVKAQGEVPVTEAELLVRITQGLPEETACRYQDLMTKRRAVSLTPEEHHELLCLADAAEALQAERARYLAELAQFRGVSLTVLVEALGLNELDGGVPRLEPGGRGDS